MAWDTSNFQSNFDYAKTQNVMNKTDIRDKLKEIPFTYLVTKALKMLIYYEGKQIMILNEKDTKKLLGRIENKSEFEIQLVLAKTTGNFKHGNEKIRGDKK